MKNPVDEAKNQRSNNIGPNARDRDRNIREMYTIYDLNGQPEDDDVDDQTEESRRQ